MSRLTNTQLGALLDDIYKIEGLLHLALSRSEYDENIQRLISYSIFDLADRTAGWDAENLMAHREADAIDAEADSLKAYSIEESEEVADNQIEEETADEREPAVMKEHLEMESADEELAEEESASALNSLEVEDEEPMSAKVEKETSLPTDDDPDDNEEANETPESESPAQEHIFVEPNFLPKDDASAQKEPIETETTEESVKETATECSETRSPRKRPSFSINDRYLFTRTLFHNSRQELEDCLNAICEMDDYDEAEDYFLNELEWNPENSETGMFMDIIHRYFDSLAKE